MNETLLIETTLPQDKNDNDIIDINTNSINNDHSINDTINKKMKLLKLSQRSPNEIIQIRSKMLNTDPYQIKKRMTEEIRGTDPFKNLLKTYKNSKELNVDPLQEVSENKKERTASIKRKKENENNEKFKFKWDKGNSHLRLSSGVEEINRQKTIVHKKSSLGTLRYDKLRSSTKDSKESKSKNKDDKQIIYVSCYNDLPKKFQREVENAKIPIESIEQNFYSLLNILHFCDHGTIFVYKEGEIERKTTSQKKSVHFDIQGKEAELITEGNPKDFYKIGTQLGKGGFGTVYEAKPKKRQKDKLAIKIIPHSNSHQKKYNLREVEYLLKYKHTNIVNLHAAYIQGEELWIVMEHLRGGTLTEARNSHRFSEAQIGYISKHMLIGIQFLHNNGLIHRDIKSQNVMMAVDGTIKLIDFGLCHDTKVFGNVIEMVGSPYWMPPEMIKGETHTFVADIWSFAICVLELANNEAPNRDNKVKAMYTVATVGLPNPLAKPERWSHNFKWFISACLKTNPSERASASDLLVHPFFKDVATRSVMTEIFSSIFITKALNTFL